MKFFKNIDDTSLHLIFLGVIAVVAIASLSWLSLSLGQTDELLSVGQAVSAPKTVALAPHNKYVDCKVECSTTNERINNQNQVNNYNKEFCPKDCDKRNRDIKKQNGNIINCQKNCDKNAPPITGLAVARRTIRIPTPEEIQKCKTSCVTNTQTQCQTECDVKSVKEQFKQSITGYMFAQITGNLVAQKVTKLTGQSLQNCKKDCMIDLNTPIPAINCEKECNQDKYPTQKLKDCKQDCAQYCTPETDDAFCLRLRKNCGAVTAQDNCGDLRQITSCGTCQQGQICDQNKCVTPQPPSGTQSSLVAGTTDNVIATAPGTQQHLATQIANIGDKNAGTSGAQVAAPVNSVPVVQIPVTPTQQPATTAQGQVQQTVPVLTLSSFWQQFAGQQPQNLEYFSYLEPRKCTVLVSDRTLTCELNQIAVGQSLLTMGASFAGVKFVAHNEVPDYIISNILVYEKFSQSYQGNFIDEYGNYYGVNVIIADQPCSSNHCEVIVFAKADSANLIDGKTVATAKYSYTVKVNTIPTNPTAKFSLSATRIASAGYAAPVNSLSDCNGVTRNMGCKLNKQLSAGPYTFSASTSSYDLLIKQLTLKNSQGTILKNFPCPPGIRLGCDFKIYDTLPSDIYTLEATASTDTTVFLEAVIPTKPVDQLVLKQLGESCGTDNDCAAKHCNPYSLVCTGGGGSGSSCSNNYDCLQLDCSLGYCGYRRNGLPCATNSWCLSNSCPNGYCGASSGSQCNSNSECATQSCIFAQNNLNQKIYPGRCA